MSQIDLVIKNARYMGKERDLFIAKGRVVKLADAGTMDLKAAEEVDAAGLTLLPSMTDAHVHLREPGFEYKEDIASGLGAAVHGGFGNIMCMANTKPVNDEAGITEAMLEKAKLAWPHGPRLLPIGALTRGLKGHDLSPMAELAEAGCVAFSNDGMPVPDTARFRNAMEYASDYDRIVIDHCEDPYLNPAAGMNEGEVSSSNGLPSQPDAAEAIQVARDVLLAEFLDLPIHLAHISCKKSVDLIAWAKKRGVKVTAETCPHYLILTEMAAATYDTAAKVNPPLRTEDDRQAVIDALNEGVLDILATDHAPHAAHEKEVEFDIAPCGISGLDTALSSTWALVKNGTMSEETFLRAWCWKPVEIFNLPACRFEPGDTADFFLFDPDEEWVVGPETMRSRGKNTPLTGSTLRGRVKAHFLAGKKIV